MLKDSTYKEKFSKLQTWMPLIVETIKKDIKNEHLRKDAGFVKKYFPGKNPSKLTSGEISEVYSHAIANGDSAEQLAEFIANRWLLKHSHIYSYFEEELGKVNPNFNEIEKLDQEIATKIMEGAVQQFGAIATYLFCILNSVVFPDEVYKKLSHDATKRALEEKTEEKISAEGASLEELKRSYDQHIARMTDKYEKKITGLEKKYLQDVEALKKQIASLQRKLNG